MKRLLEGVAMLAAFGVAWVGWLAISLVATAGLGLVLLLLSKIPFFVFLDWVSDWAYRIVTGGISLVIGTVVVVSYFAVCIGSILVTVLCIFKRQWPFAIKAGGFALVMWSPVLLIVYLTVWAR